MVSDITLTKREAVQKAVESLKKKTLFGFISQQREFDDVDEQDIDLLYFPYYVALTENIVSSKVLKEFRYNLMFAVEGYTGETGITVGVPTGCERHLEDIEEGIVIRPRVSEDEAEEKIKKCAVSYIMRKNRHVPATSILRMDTVWKPTYMIPVKFRDKDSSRSIVRFIDAESGYTVYRYDLIWKSILQHSM